MASDYSEYFSYEIPPCPPFIKGGDWGVLEMGCKVQTSVLMGVLMVC